METDRSVWCAIGGAIWGGAGSIFPIQPFIQGWQISGDGSTIGLQIRIEKIFSIQESGNPEMLFRDCEGQFVVEIDIFFWEGLEIAGI